MQDSLPGTVQDMLDKNHLDDHLKVTFVKIPITAAIPFIGPAKSEGYFMVEKKEGDKLDCDLEPFNLEVRDGPDSRYAVYIPGEDAQKLMACDLQAVGVQMLK
ncbi:hypothetical protein [Mesorhizobium sp. M1E.F.Ca.ET.063.01.1.1]|uniref:hypothetical protein n=1 Tax=Mesorhizobium sp. M1E.F.Ca.ET.063.01.1.1 TaxID=2496750 RepID=UPI001671A630|nr:hypothetical protein [Mesorhizobium sp. M1E.F.Ca.ET.063.01.1.1]